METLFHVNGFADHTMAVLSFLLNTTLKCTVILLCAYGFSRSLRRASSATRHFVWTMAISGILLLPVFSLILPSWTVSISPVLLTEKTRNPVLDSSGSAMEPGSPNTSTLQKASMTKAPPETLANDPNSKDNDPALKTHTQTFLQSLVENVQTFARSASKKQASILLFCLWAAGTSAIFLRQLVGRVHIWQTGRRSVEVTDSKWTRLFNELKNSYRIRRRVQLLKSDSIPMPMTWGFRRPKILLPAEADHWPDDRRRFVLLHELSHIKRWDTLTQLFAQIAGAFYWMNPFVWIANRQFLKEREHACDDFVLKGGSKASEYAGLILDIAQTSHPKHLVSLATVAMARRTQLEGRLLAILNPKLSRRALTHAAAVLLAVFPLAAMRPTIRREVSFDSASPSEKVEQVAQHETAKNSIERKNAVGTSEINTVKKSPESTANEPADEVQIKNPKDATDKNDPIQSQSKQTKSKQDKNNPVVQSLCEALKDPSLDVRLQAAQTLGRLEDKAAVQALVSALKDDHWQMRVASAEALSRIRNKAAVPGLIEALKDEDWHVRERMAEALGELDDPVAIPALSQAAQDPNRNIRKTAVWAMGEIQDRTAVEPLSRALKDENWEIRKEAAEALGKLEDPSAIAPLSAAIQDPVMDVRKAVIEALNDIDNPKTAEPLIQAMNDEHWEIRKAAAEAVGDLEDARAVRPLLALLKNDTHWEVRKEAVEALGDIGDSAAVDAMIGALNDPTAEVRKAAVSTLGDFENPRAVKPLLSLLGSAESVDALIQALTDPDWEVRKQAARALGEIGDPKAMDPLSLRLKDENEEVRRAAAEAFGDLRWRNE